MADILVWVLWGHHVRDHGPELLGWGVCSDGTARTAQNVQFCIRKRASSRLCAICAPRHQFHFPLMPWVPAIPRVFIMYSAVVLLYV